MVRRRRWVRPLHRTGIGAGPPALSLARVESVSDSRAMAEIPEGLLPFCRALPGGGVMVMVHENQVSGFPEVPRGGWLRLWRLKVFD